MYTPTPQRPPQQRERREWGRERAQLLTVIELQQRELGKRGGSVQERAAEIARDFARSVLGFEERLLTGGCVGWVGLWVWGWEGEGLVAGASLWVFVIFDHRITPQKQIHTQTVEAALQSDVKEIRRAVERLSLGASSTTTSPAPSPIPATGGGAGAKGGSARKDHHQQQQQQQAHGAGVGGA